MIRRFLTGVAAASMLAMPAMAMSGADVIKAVTNGNGQTIDIPEAVAASAKVFESLSKDKGQTVDRAEIGDRVSESDWATVNKDHDKTLELDEWLTVMRARFNAADADHSGKLDAKELDTPAGQALSKMLVK